MSTGARGGLEAESNKKLLGARGIATSNKCIATSNKKLLVAMHLDQHISKLDHLDPAKLNCTDYQRFEEYSLLALV